MNISPACKELISGDTFTIYQLFFGRTIFWGERKSDYILSGKRKYTLNYFSNFILANFVIPSQSWRGKRLSFHINKDAHMWHNEGQAANLAN